MDIKGGVEKYKMIDLFIFMFESICFYSQLMAKVSSQIIRGFAEKFYIAELVEEISDKLGEHPVLRVLAVATALCCAIPVVTFVAFVLVSLIVTFTGFIVVEGIVLAAGGLCMVLCLATMVMVMSVLAIILGVSYFVAIKFLILFKKYQSPSRGLRHLQPATISNRRHISNSIDDVHQD